MIEDWRKRCPFCSKTFVSEGTRVTHQEKYHVTHERCNTSPREKAMVTICRDKDGKPSVWCDPCIASIVKALNDAGIKTVASCCGHGKRPGNIALRNGLELIIKEAL